MINPSQFLSRALLADAVFSGVSAVGLTLGAGVLAPVGWESTQGKTPRFFALDPDGATLYVANQDSDTIVCFRVDPFRGLLTPTGQVIQTGSPSSIVFA